MAGINFILGIDGSKARAQAEAAGKDIKNGIDKSTKGTSKGVDDLSKSLGTARSNAKQLHEDLIGMAAGGTKSMSSMIGFAGDLAKALKSPAGAVTAVIATVVAMAKVFADAVASSAELIRSDLSASLEVAHDRANDINDINLSKFRKELNGAADDINRMGDAYGKAQNLYTEVLDAESRKRIAIIDYQENAGVISHEEAAKRRLAVDETYMKRNFELAIEARDREVAMKRALVAEATKGRDKAISSANEALTDKGNALQALGRTENAINSTELGTWVKEGATQSKVFANNLNVINGLLEKYNLPKIEAPKEMSHLLNPDKNQADIYEYNTEQEVAFQVKIEAARKDLIAAINAKAGELSATRTRLSEAESELAKATLELAQTRSLYVKKYNLELETTHIEGQTNIANGAAQDTQYPTTKSIPEQAPANNATVPDMSGVKTIPRPDVSAKTYAEENAYLKALVEQARITAEASKAIADNTKGLQPK